MHSQSRFIESLYKKLAKKHFIKVFNFSNNGNHLHFVSRSKTREGFRKFVTAFSGGVAQKMTESWKGRAKDGKFWDHIPFTQILEWGRDLQNTIEYVIQNYLEYRGLVPYEPRVKRRKAVAAS